MGKFIDLAGRVFGKLTVISRDTNAGGATRWKCACECGELVTTHASNLMTGKSMSCGCGCFGREPPNKHGHVGTPAYNSWAAMIQRCTNHKCKNYKDWGGRGVSVCDEWKSFLGFHRDMGDPPGQGYTIERIDNDGNYEPSNCRWATRTEQSNNRRNVRKFRYKGNQYTMSQLSALCGVDYFTLRQRIVRYGWSVHRSVTTR